MMLRLMKNGSSNSRTLLRSSPVPKKKVDDVADFIALDADKGMRGFFWIS